MKFYTFIQKNIIWPAKRTALVKFFSKTRIYRKLQSFYGKRLNDEQHIYPIEIPGFCIKNNLDFLLLELPARYTPMLPNGLGYLELILKKTKAVFQLLDVNIIIYHHFHSARLLDGENLQWEGRKIINPWETENSFLWKDSKFCATFQSYWNQLLDAIVNAKPRMVGFSVHENNRIISNWLAEGLREKLPECKIVAGGYDCYHPTTGKLCFPDFDYMFIGEAEKNLSIFIDCILNGRPVCNIPGIISRDDTDERQWERCELLEDLDTIGYPAYEFCSDLSIYREYGGESRVPLSASRGCVWSRCRFCGECIKFRCRAPEKVFDEIKFFYSRGFNIFTFNESDCNGKPENLYNLCKLIIQSGIKIKLMGQLRIHKSSNIEYFKTLHEAGFSYLRFGVDGFCNDILNLECKGYNMALVESNLKACHDAGIYVAINIVVGVPGETDEMIETSCANLDRLGKYIDSVDSLNTLMLNAGSCYYSDPEAYNIKFLLPKEEIYQKYPLVIPTEVWHSEEPYIDQKIRINRMNKITRVIFKHNIKIGEFALKMLNIHGIN